MVSTKYLFINREGTKGDLEGCQGLKGEVPKVRGKGVFEMLKGCIF